MKRLLALSLLALPVALAAMTGSPGTAEAKKLGRVILPPGSTTPPPTVRNPDTRYYRNGIDTVRTRDASNSSGGVTVDVTRSRRW